MKFPAYFPGTNRRASYVRPPGYEEGKVGARPLSAPTLARGVVGLLPFGELGVEAGAGLGGELPVGVGGEAVELEGAADRGRSRAG
jgi:hypothetical protein